MAGGLPPQPSWLGWRGSRLVHEFGFEVNVEVLYFYVFVIYFVVVVIIYIKLTVVRDSAFTHLVVNTEIILNLSDSVFFAISLNRDTERKVTFNSDSYSVLSLVRVVSITTDTTKELAEDKIRSIFF